MRDKDLYTQVLGITVPWSVREVELSSEEEQVVVKVEYIGDRLKLACPHCQASCKSYGNKVRRWRHLDTCQYQTILEAEIPRVKCQEHGVVQLSVPWAEEYSRFTILFERLVIDWLKEASISAVSKRCRLSWDEVDGIMLRAVERGLRRREMGELKRLGVDETSFRKRHKYITVVNDLCDDRVIFVGEGRREKTLDKFYERLSQKQLEDLEFIAMDMCRPYIASTLKNVPYAKGKIAFDKFHVMRMFNHAVDQVRREENKKLLEQDDTTLKGTRYWWLMRPENMTELVNFSFKELKKSSLKTARAWAIKNMAQQMWFYTTKAGAVKSWLRLASWATHSQLDPMRTVGRSIQRRIQGIVTAILSRVNNAKSEAMNARIQWLKKTACGFRSQKRFANAIYFYLGKLDLYPLGNTKFAFSCNPNS